MHLISALVAGFLFGLGLSISGMTMPGRVLGFLDVAGDWDPALAFVMGGALLVFMPAFYLLRKFRTQPILGGAFDMPSKTHITPRLAIGATIFGAGWGLSGFCPGTAITSLPTTSSTVLILVAGVIIGILLTWGAEAASSQTDVNMRADF